MSATAPSHMPTVSADPQTTSYVTLNEAGLPTGWMHPQNFAFKCPELNRGCAARYVWKVNRAACANHSRLVIY